MSELTFYLPSYIIFMALNFIIHKSLFSLGLFTDT